LEQVPLEYTNHPSLQKIAITKPTWKNFPEVLCTIQGLKELKIIGQVKVKQIPPSIGQLKNLETLDLSYGDIRTLPTTLNQLKKLTTFNLKGNYITNTMKAQIKKAGLEKALKL
jgi:hypothetical protein